MRHYESMSEDVSARRRSFREWWLLIWGYEAQRAVESGRASFVDGGDGTEETRSWLTDDADRSLAPKGGRADFLNRAWEIIDEGRVQKFSVVFGLVGPWGSGKSSMLDWFREKAGEEPAEHDAKAWNVLTFNPWDFPDSSALQLGFFAALQSSFGSSKLDSARKVVSELGVAVAPLTAVTAAWGLFDASKIVENSAKLLGGNHSVDAARRKLVKILEQAKTPVLIIIDDLDRISADELLLTLKLIRQLGRLPYVHYLLSYDESTILDVLTRTSLIGSGEVGRAREYMEKVIQVRFDVPQLRPDDVLELANTHLRELGDATGHSLGEEQLERFSTAYFGFMADRLSTPRSIRRFFAQARLLSPRLLGELDLSDFLVLTWLRTFEPGVYALLQRRRKDLIGDAVTYGRSRDAAEVERQRQKSRETWNLSLRNAGTREEDLAHVLRAVSSIFPRLSDAVNSSTEDSIAKHPRIAHEEGFDRYFTAGISDRDIADSTVRKAVADMEAGSGKNSVAVVETTIGLLEIRALTTSKLIRAAKEASISAPETFAWLAKIYNEDLAQTDPLRSTYRIEQVISDRLREMPSEAALAALDAVATERGGILVANTVNKATYSPQAGTKVLELTVAIQNLVTASLRIAIYAEGATIDHMSWNLWNSVLAWKHLSAEGFRNWLLEEKSARGDIAALAFFVSLTQTMGSTREVHLERVNLQEASEYFDLIELKHKLKQEIAAAPLIDIGSFSDTPDTPENRRLAVLNALKTWEAQPVRAAESR